MLKKLTVFTILMFGIMYISIGSSIYNDDIDSINYNADKDIKFIIVGDPHVTSKISDDSTERLRLVVNFVNKLDIDFIIFIGDMTKDGTYKSNKIVKDILKNMKKPYYVVAGNHDIMISPDMFRSFYGSMEHVEKIKGYQLLFIGIYEYDNGTLDWSFDFSKVDKNVPTLVFIHGPVKDLPFGCIHCYVDTNEMMYAKSVEQELDKFTSLIGVYAGHVHYDSNKIVNGVRYVTVNGLTNMEIGKHLKINVITPSDKVGYSIIKDNISYYELISYNDK